MERAAADQIGSAARAQAGHILGDLTTSIAKKIESYFDSKKQEKDAKVTTSRKNTESNLSIFNSSTKSTSKSEVHDSQGRYYANS